MNVEYHKRWSRSLGQDMEIKVYGHSGQPFIVFPTSSGRFYDFEDSGMIDAAERFIRDGKVKLFCVDSIDPQSWDNTRKTPEEKARRHNDYDSYVISEAVPFIKTHCAADVRIMCTGVSMGASHSVLFFLKHPDVFNGTIALSGIYNFRFFLNGYRGDSLDVYYNSPLDFLPDLNDEWYLDKYRESAIVICVGQGAWEEPMIADTARIKEILESKNIPCLIDFWGHDVNHDWPWWRIQFPHFLEKLYGAQ